MSHVTQMQNLTNLPTSNCNDHSILWLSRFKSKELCVNVHLAVPMALPTVADPAE